MPYSFIIQSILTRRIICPSPSIIDNSYIDYTAQGFRPTDPISASSSAIWVANSNPQFTQNNYSRPSQIYNPYICLFLGDTEEITNISNTPESYATITGTLSFESSDNSSHFIFKYISNNKFQIYLHESDNNHLNQRRLLIDINNNSRVLLSKDEINNSETLNDTWEIINIFN